MSNSKVANVHGKHKIVFVVVVVVSNADMQLHKILILDFHRGMNTDFWFRGFCKV